MDASDPDPVSNALSSKARFARHLEREVAAAAGFSDQV